MIKRATAFAAAMLIGATAFAADDASIRGTLRADIKQAMAEHVAASTLDGSYVIYDAVDGNLHRLRFDAMHEGVVRKGDFYVSCADFTDTATDTYFDLDFLVAGEPGDLRVIQALVHKKGSSEREYHVHD